MISNFIKQKAIIFLVFLVWGFLIYSNTFDASFHFDDGHVVSDLSFEEVLERYKGGGSRVIPHLTFLFNYWLGGTDVLGYHLFNIIVHIGTSYFVYLFLFTILSFSNTEGREYNRHTSRVLPPFNDPVFWPAFLGGMLFLVHPLATQAVTYITQRYASLAGFFYIGSLAFFASARIRFKEQEQFLKGFHLLPYCCSFVMAVCAMRSKEMAITLPATLLLTEYCFVQSDLGGAKRRILYLLPLLATGLIIPVSDIVGVEGISLESVAALQEYTWGKNVSRSEYLLTQIKIILAVYLKLSVWPIGQNVDHDYVVSKTLFDLPTFGALLSLCMILGAGLYLFRRARFVSFGIVWFFVTISPTSSIVPNVEFVAEHRAYISLMGLSFAAASLPSWQVRCKSYLMAWLPVLLILSGITFARNAVWETDITLWSDATLKSPANPRALNNLGGAYLQEGLADRAIPVLQESIALNQDMPASHNNLGASYLEKEWPEKAAVEFNLAIKAGAKASNPYTGLGIAYQMMGQTDEAIRQHNLALKIKPNRADLHINLGMSYHKKRWLDKAIEHFQRAIQIEPDNAEAHYNLGITFGSIRRVDLAYKEMRLAKKLSSPAEWEEITKGIRGSKVLPRRHQ